MVGKLISKVLALKNVMCLYLAEKSRKQIKCSHNHPENQKNKEEFIKMIKEIHGEYYYLNSLAMACKCKLCGELIWDSGNKITDRGVL
jgi:hypothetical protein